MKFTDQKFKDWKLVITSPTGHAFAYVSPGGAVALGSFGKEDVLYILPPNEVAAIIKALEEINPQVLNSCLSWAGAKTQFNSAP